MDFESEYGLNLEENGLHTKLAMLHILGFKQPKGKLPTLQMRFIRSLVGLRGLTLFKSSSDEQSMDELEEIINQA